MFVLSTYEIFDHFVAMLSRPTEVFEQQVKSRDLEAIDMTLQKLIGFIKACTLEDIES